MSIGIIRLACRGVSARLLLLLLLFWVLINQETAAQNFWQPAKGPYGGEVQAIAINNTNGYTFIGTRESGIFRSKDNGVLWEEASTGLPNNADVLSLAVNSEGNVFAGSADGIFLSTNDGGSWKAINTNLTSKDVRAIAINKSGHIFAGIFDGGVFRSTNNGGSWTSVGNPLKDKGVKSLAINVNGYIFVGTNGNGVFRSTSGGNDWKEISTGLKNKDVWSLVIDVSGNIFAATNGGGVFRLRDNDTSWTQVVLAGLTNKNVKSLAIKASGDIFAGTNGGGVFRLLKNDTSWTPVNNELTNTDVRALAINSHNHILAGTFGGGVFVSENDGTSWKLRNTGLTDMFAWSLAINDVGHIFAGTDKGGVFRSTDNGDNWTPVNTGLTGALIVRSLAIGWNRHVFAGTFDKGIFHSLNEGGIWESVSNGLTKNDVRALAVDRVKKTIFAGTSGGGVFLSKDSSKTWTPANSGLMNLFISCLVINASGEVFAGTDGGGVFSLKNNETNWTSIINGLENLNIFSLAINSRGDIFAGTRGGIFRLKAGDTKWTKVNANLTSFNIYSLAINLNDQIFAGTSDGGVFRSTNNGESWAKINTGLTKLVVRSLAIDAQGFLFAGTVGSGVARSTQSTLVPVFGPFTPDTTADKGTAKKISIPATSVIDPSGIKKVELYYRISGYFFAAKEMKPENGSYSASIPADTVTDKGAEFYIRATNIAGNSTPTRTYSILVNVPMGIKRLEPQPSGSSLSFYRLISIPLIPDNSSAEKFIAANPDLGGPDPKTWRLYGFDRAKQPPFVKYPNFSISPDQGYLLIVNKPNVYLKTGSGRTVKTADPYRIPLPAGWSIIGNPFNYDIPFDSLSVTSGELEIYSLVNGGWQPNNAGLRAWEGYAIHVRQNDTLVIGAGKVGLSRANNPFDLAHADERNWLIQIKAKLNDTEDVFNFVGQKENASPHYDKMDLHKAPAIGGDVRLEISHPDWQEQAQEAFTTDIRQVNAAGQFYDFDVLTTTADGVGTLSFAGIEKLPKDYLVYLVDKTGKTSINLRNNPEHHFAPVSSGKKSFRLLVGKREFVAQNSEGVDAFPTRYHLAQNYPNPFSANGTPTGIAFGNPATTIQYSLPELSLVRLEIFDLLGQKVRTLIQANQPADNYSVVWDGKNEAGVMVPSGVYFYRLHTGRFEQSKKLILMR